MATFTAMRDLDMLSQPVDGLLVTVVPRDGVVEELAAPAGSPGDWMLAIYMEGPVPRRGWIPRSADDVKEGGAVSPLPIVEERFVRYAQSVAAVLNATEPYRLHPALHPVTLAIASIVSDMKNVENGNRIGPFQYTPADWGRILADSDSPPNFFGPGDLIINPFSQLAAASVEMHRNGKEMTRLHAEAKLSTADDPFVPDVRSIFHGHLLGPKAAFALWQARQEGAPEAPSLVALVSTAQGIDEATARKVLEERPSFYLKGGAGGGAPLSVAEFITSSSDVLNRALEKVQVLIDKYIPELVPTKGTSRWMKFAEKAKDKVSEATSRDTIAAYFDATDHPKVGPGDALPPWCGAFAAHCMKEAGAPVPKGAAAAANWSSWGDRGLTAQGMIPPGAVVVLSKSPDSGPSGHVGFFVSKSSTHVKLLGGNQSNRVCERDFPLDRIAAVRWLGLTEGEYNPDGIPAGTSKIADLIVARFAAAGFAKHHQIAALANAIRESELNPQAHRVTEKEDSVGLFQCNRKGGLGQGFSVAQLMDPEFNIKLTIGKASSVKRFVNATTVNDAIDAFVRFVEIPKDKKGEIELRINIAKKLH